MTRVSAQYDSTVILDTPEGYVECPAVFDIEGTTGPAEPYSWGGSRGDETTMRAELVKAQFGGLTLTRDMAARITGEAHLSQQEDAIAQLYADRMCGVAA